MHQTLRVAIGASLVGASLPDGNLAVAAQVDNPSGQWLSVYPGGITVPPYTQGWVARFAEARVDVRPMLVGPAGQVPTSTGDPVTVTLYDDAEAPLESEGSPFVEGFTPTLEFMIQVNARTFVSVSPFLVNAIAGKRFRLLGLGMTYTGPVGAVSASGVSIVVTSVTGPDVPLYISPSAPSDRVVFMPGLDFPVGEALSVLVALCDYADQAVLVAGSYQVV